MTLADSAGSAGATLAAILFTLIGVALYVLPGVIGMIRHVPNSGSVWVINIFAGWTFVGWIIALAMAVRSHRPPQYVVPSGWQPPAPPGFQPPPPVQPQPQPQAQADKPYGYQ